VFSQAGPISPRVDNWPGASMPRLNRHSPLPLHHQLSEILRARIEAHDYASGNRFLSESEIEGEFGVSRNTVRRAIDTLIGQGLIRRDRGRGAFIISQSIGVRTRIERFVEHFETLRRAGYEPGVRHFGTRRIPASKELEAVLGLTPGQELVLFDKLFLASEQPAIFARDYIAAARLGDSFDVTGSGTSFFRFLEDCCGRTVDFIMADIAAVNADREVATRLGVAVGAAVLLLKEQFLDPSQRLPLAFAENYYLPSIIQFKILRKRELE